MTLMILLLFINRKYTCPCLASPWLYGFQEEAFHEEMEDWSHLNSFSIHNIIHRKKLVQLLTLEILHFVLDIK